MIPLSLLLIAALTLVIATYTDLKTLEVPDWLNYAGIAAGLGIHLIFSLQQWTLWPIISSLGGLAIAFAFACLMFYTGQWGGGDAKLLMALGALFGFAPDKFAFSTSFLINLVFIGALWGFAWTMGLALVNVKKFWRTFRALRAHKGFVKLRLLTFVTVFVLVIAALVLTPFRLEFALLAITSYFLAQTTIYIKSVELSCMHKWVTPDKLTEGDWAVHAVKVGDVEVTPGKLGLEKEDVENLRTLYRQGKLDKVCVKYGVPFVPAFLIAFLVTLSWNNVLLTVITLFVVPNV